MMYYYPAFDDNDLYDKSNTNRLLHWINFFGGEGLYTIRERIQKVLDINATVFAGTYSYADDILEIFDRSSSIYQSTIVSSAEPPGSYASEFLTPHMSMDADTVHHIIFENQYMGGLKRKNNSDNIYPLARGPHTSFHELLCQKNLYPHQQLYRFLSDEKDVLCPDLYATLLDISAAYQDVFVSDPLSVYKQSCFEPSFLKKMGRLTNPRCDG